MNFNAVDAKMRQGVDDRVFPGAVLLAASRGVIAFHEAYGKAAVLPEPRPMRRETIFDLSSLTKPLVATTALLLLLQEGKISLESRASSLLPHFSGPEKELITLRHLLSHCSGLPAWVGLYERLDRKEISHPGLLGTPAAKAYVYEEVCREPLVYEVGTATTYSDLGFILLGAIVERVGGEALDRFCRVRIFEPLGLRRTFFLPLDAPAPLPLSDFAATELCPWRQGILCARVHDENAYAMGGIAGHAGLFSSSLEIHDLIGQWVRAWHGHESLLSPELAREFCARQEIVANSTRALGWDTPSASGSSSGRFFPSPSIGHLGFTGTSVWIDLKGRNWVILLTNRVHPTRGNDKIRRFRPEIHDLVLNALGAA